MLMKMKVGLDQSRFHTISAVATGGRERGQRGGPTPTAVCAPRFGMLKRTCFGTSRSFKTTANDVKRNNNVQT